MSQAAYVLLTVLTSVLSLIILGFTLFDMFRIRRQRQYARWLLEEAMESTSKTKAPETSRDEWQILRDLVSRQRPRVHKML